MFIGYITIVCPPLAVDVCSQIEWVPLSGCSQMEMEWVLEIHMYVPRWSGCPSLYVQGQIEPPL